MFSPCVGSVLTHDNGEYFPPYKAGSVSEHIETAIEQMLAGKQPGPLSQKCLVENDCSAASLRRNPLLFLNGALDFSCIAVGSSRSSAPPYCEAAAPVLISPRHVLTATHMGFGSMIHWMNAAGEIVTRNLVSSGAFDDVGLGASPDIKIGYLDAPINDIDPAEFFPAGWESYFPGAFVYAYPNLIELGYLPFIARVMHDPAGAVSARFVAGQMVSFSVPYSSSHNAMRCDVPSLVSQHHHHGERWARWYGDILSGDSGGPVFFPINGKVVLLCTFYGAGGGLLAVSYRDPIENLMNSLAAAQGDLTVYNLASSDWSSFVVE